MSRIDTILVATDFSERAARAENRAAMLRAQVGDGTIELLTVKEAGLPDTLARAMNSSVESAHALIAEQTERELRSRAATLQDNHGIHCAHAVRFGGAAGEIVGRADQVAAGLIVAGAHGGNFFTDLLLGNTADKLVRISKRPLLVVKNEARQPYRQVLVPVDFSQDAEHAARLALDIAPDADITFLHAFDVSFEGHMQYANVSRDLINDYRVRAREDARIELNRFIDALQAKDRNLTRVITFGLPGPVVRDHAKAMKPDLIVMGKHGRSRFEEMLIGSVTRDTMDQSDADILIVSSQIRDAAKA